MGTVWGLSGNIFIISIYEFTFKLLGSVFLHDSKVYKMIIYMNGINDDKKASLTFTNKLDDI